MKLPFLRKPAHDDLPLVVAMTGVRLGDRVIFAGTASSLLIPLAARTGLSGQLLTIGSDTAELTRRAERAGHLVDGAGAPPADGSYDLAVVETSGDWTQMLAPLLAAVRPGGRIVIVIGRQAEGALALLKPAHRTGPAPAEVVALLERSGWHRARSIGSREGLDFVEAVRTA
jgi:tRNA A58 N-methylase Trm61